ncbi:hypothetical protein CYMTET_39856 [Cymbomonas tetramitiformis]|uniref:Mitochondrial fission process protein 1 n=1 Tax=Cymbomonas tetramitiformis TaxID=36881 RepID=A0AAE0F571_9CHLO|nr:hypothetical protein CYMTET_39856 [Cymbomonas tetramitiformis]
MPAVTASPLALFLTTRNRHTSRPRLAIRAQNQASTSHSEGHGEKLAEAQKWFAKLSRRAQMAVLGTAGALTMAEQAAFAHGADASSISDLPVVVGGVAFGFGMCATGHILAEKLHHGNEEAAEPRTVCADDIESEDGYTCNIEFPEVDLYRDTLLRYLGYSNECGEAFRPLVGNFWANMTYIIAVSYVLADAVDKGAKANRTSAMNRASEAFKRLDTDLQGYLTYEQVRAAFRELRLPLTLDQVNAYLAKADVLKNNRITYDEFMWSIERADTELQMLMDAGSRPPNADEIVPNALRGLRHHGASARNELSHAQQELSAAANVLDTPDQSPEDKHLALESLKAGIARLQTVEMDLESGNGSLDRLSAVGLNWKPKPFQSTIWSAVAGVDALVWQLTASVIMPGFTINRIVTLASLLVAEYGPTEGVAAQLASISPTVLGLGVIPFIVRPLDVLADVLLDVTMRKAIFAAMDTDKSGSLDLEELTEKLSNRPEYLPADKVKELFEEMDTNGDGVISMEEWSNGGFSLYKKYSSMYGASRRSRNEEDAVAIA